MRNLFRGKGNCAMEGNTESIKACLGLPISQEHFEKFSPTEQAYILYDCLRSVAMNQVELSRRLEHKVKVDKVLAAIFGFMGGFIAQFTGVDKLVK